MIISMNFENWERNRETKFMQLPTTQLGQHFDDDDENKDQLMRKQVQRPF